MNSLKDFQVQRHRLPPVKFSTEKKYYFEEKFNLKIIVKILC